MNNELYGAFAAVKATLEAITTGGGYNYTVAKVQAGSDAEPKAGLNIYLHELSVEQARKSFNCIRATATLSIRAVLAGMPGEMEDKGLKAWADVEMAMQAVSSTYIENINPLGGTMTFQRDADAAIVDIKFGLSLYWAATAP